MKTENRVPASNRSTNPIPSYSHKCWALGLLLLATSSVSAQTNFTDANWSGVFGLPGTVEPGGSGTVYAIAADANGNVYVGVVPKGRIRN